MPSSDKRLFIFIIVCSFCMALFGYIWKNRTEIPHITAPIMNVGTPFFYGSTRILEGAESASVWIKDVFQHREALIAMEAQQANLGVDKVKYEEVVAENLRLRQLLRFQTNNPQYTLRAAHIILRDFGDGTKTFVIDLGENQGIQKYMPVVAPAGLVGFVSDVYANSARVQSILDPRTSTGVIVQRPESRLATLARGNVASPTSLELINVPKDGDVLEGDTLITSGLGGLYPKGIVVGHIGDVQKGKEGFISHADIYPAVNMYKIEEVFVIMGFQVAPVQPVNDTVKLVPPTKRDQVEGVKGAIQNETH